MKPLRSARTFGLVKLHCGVDFCLEDLVWAVSECADAASKVFGEGRDAWNEILRGVVVAA